MIKAISALLLMAITAFAIADDRLEGAFERVSLTNTRTGESPEAANRQGLLLMAHGHYSMMTMNPDRRFVANDEVAAMPAEDQIAYLEEWLDINGHTGRYEVEGDTLTWYRDISETREKSARCRRSISNGGMSCWLSGSRCPMAIGMTGFGAGFDRNRD